MTSRAPLTILNNDVAQLQTDAQTTLTDAETCSGDAATLLDYVNATYGPGSSNPDPTLVGYATTVSGDADDVVVDSQNVLNELTALTTVSVIPPVRLQKKARTQPPTPGVKK